MVFTWEAKVIAAAAAAAADTDAAAETNWKHKVTPDWGDLMKITHFENEQNNCFKILNMDFNGSYSNFTNAKIPSWHKQNLGVKGILYYEWDQNIPKLKNWWMFWE